MKLATSTVETEGNLEFSEVVDMELDQGARGIIIKAFIDQYSNPYVAAMREYTSNAKDSHFMAGQTRAVELTLPTRLSPNLIVQDWGVGLDRAELRRYAQFGTSTKRDTNDQIGGFGFGSKSGLAVCSRFTVISVKDGIRNTVIIGRDEDGPKMKMLEEELTDEGDGLKVIIPTTETYKFSSALAQNFFIGWEPGSLLVDGSEPEVSVYDTSRFKPLGTYGWLSIGTRGEHWSSHDAYNGVGLVGPVKYAINWDQAGIENPAARQGVLQEVIVKLDNGAVDLTPSRENLIYSKRTREHIQARVRAALEEGKREYTAQIDSADSIRDAMTLMIRAIRFGFAGDYTFAGKKIEIGDVTPDVQGANYTVGHTTQDYQGKFKTHKTVWGGRQVFTWDFLSGKALGEDNGQRSLLVFGCDQPERLGRSYTAHKQVMQIGLLAQGLAERDGAKPKDYLVTYTDRALDEFPETFLAAYTETMSADDARQIVKEVRRAKNAGTRTGSTYTKHDNDVVRVLDYSQSGQSNYSEHKIKDLDTNIKYIVLQNGASTYTDAIKGHLTTRVGYDNTRWLNVPVNMVLQAKGQYRFLLANKAWKTDNYSQYITMVSFDEAVRDLYAPKVTNITGIQMTASADRARNGSYWAVNFPVGRLSEINDQATQEWLRHMSDRSIETKLTLINEMATAEQHAKRYNATADYTGGITTVKVKPEPSPLERYPLLGEVSYSRKYDAIIEYINMKDMFEKMLHPVHTSV